MSTRKKEGKACTLPIQKKILISIYSGTAGVLWNLWLGAKQKIRNAKTEIFRPYNAFYYEDQKS